MKKKFFLSTALPYVNSKPHLGFALEIIQADVIARYHRLKCEDVFFLTGTDENSLKNVQAAEKAGIAIQEFVDRNAQNFYVLKDILNLSFNDFIRTTEKRHIRGAQKFWQACKKDIYKKKYKGLYCVGCEEFYKESELENGFCPEHKKPLEIVEEENYFFRLSEYALSIKKFFRSQKICIIPENRTKEVLSFVDQGLQDICISRSNERAKNWGIDVPGDHSQKMWCWFDALSNYITALGYAEDSKAFKGYWQENKRILHVIGKGISRFHAIYWIGMLLSAGLNLPKTILIHGYMTVGGEKMSKSLGNVIDPFELVEKYTQKIGNQETAVDAVRYFLLREISPTEDGDFTYERFEARYNSDLANGLGNLAARVLTLATKLKVKNEKGKTKIKNEKLGKQIQKTQTRAIQFLEAFRFNEALASVWELIGFCDKTINETKPWEIGDEELKIKNEKVISDLLLTLKEIADLLSPFLPQTSERIFHQIKIGKSQPLFPRI